MPKTPKEDDVDAQSESVALTLKEEEREAKRKRNFSKLQRARRLGQKYDNTPAIEKKSIGELPKWVRMSLVEGAIEEATYAECAKKYGRKGSTLKAYANSPAGKEWRAQIEVALADPLKMSEMMLRASAANTTVDYLMAFQSAIDAGDYREVGVMARDILDRLGVTKKTSGEGAAAKQTIVINLGGGVSLEAPTVSTSYESSVEGEDYETIEADE